jgi:hypothetical protein
VSYICDISALFKPYVMSFDNNIPEEDNCKSKHVEECHICNISALFKPYVMSLITTFLKMAIVSRNM